MRKIKFRILVEFSIKMDDGSIYPVYTIEQTEKKKLWYKENGYILRKANHPNTNKRGYIAEHRLIMERHLGRFLDSTEIIHHRDQNRENNNLSNLELQGNQSKYMKDQSHLIGKRNLHGQFISSEPIFSELKFRLFDKDKGTTRIYSLATLIGTTFRRGGFEFRGRFTGLKDKNNNHIYEGDIVKVSYPNENCNFTDEIVFGEIQHDTDHSYYLNKYIGFGFKNLRDKNGEETKILDVDMKMDVIGNIYENPELIKK